MSRSSEPGWAELSRHVVQDAGRWRARGGGEAHRAEERRLQQEVEDAEDALPQCWLEGFIRSGSMILKVRASATLRPPAMAGSRASVASPRARSRGGRATQVVQERLQLDLLVDLSEVVDALLQALGHRHPSAPCRPLPTPPHPSAGCHAAGGYSRPGAPPSAAQVPAGPSACVHRSTSTRIDVDACLPCRRAAGRPRVRPVRRLGRALGDPLRWRIVLLLAGERLCVGHLAEQLGAAQPLVSHHLKALRAAGLIQAERYRYWTYYRLRPAALDGLADQLWLLARTSPAATACRRLAGADHAPPSPAAHPRPSMPPAPSARGGTVMAHRQLDPISRQAFAAAIGELAEEFRGIFSLETVERYVDESIDRMSGARVVEFIPLFVHRFARDRLRALGQVEGAIVKDVPEVLFVCVHNAGRSQMAAALLDHHARGMVHVRSAGSDPADRLNPAVVAAMAEWEIDLSKEFPKPLTDEVVQAVLAELVGDRPTGRQPA